MREISHKSDQSYNDSQKDNNLIEGENPPLSPHSGAQREDFEPDRKESLKKLNQLRQIAFDRVRKVPTPEAMAKRRARLNLAKWALPCLAAFLLVSIAAWPEVTHLIHQNGAILREMRKIRFETGHIDLAVYHNIDSKGHPYTLTANAAHQINEDRVNLDQPEADILLGGQSWLHLSAEHGVYCQHEQTLNLNGHVILYRSDGFLLHSPTMDADLKALIAASHDWVHAEGPFGTQDSEGMFLDENRGLLEFLGPGLTVLFHDIPSDLTPKP